MLLDASRSQEFGAAGAHKKDAAIEICATLAFAAAGNRDEAGLILFSSEVELYVPPGSGESHMLRLIRDVLALRPRAGGTSLARALEFLVKVRRRRSLVFVISDFQDRGFEPQLRIASRRHDVVAVSMFDTREERLPDCGLLECEDPESGARVLLDTSDAGVRAAHAAAAVARAARLGEIFREAKVDHLRIEAGVDYVPRLVSFLRMRGRRD